MACGPHAQAALHVVERLRHAGFKAYLAGGCVRDLLLGRSPKDYDVATPGEGAGSGGEECTTS